MEERQTDKLLFELRERISDMMAAMQLLAPLVREKGDGRDRDYLAVLSKSAYRMIRSVHHIGACAPELFFHPMALDLAGLCRYVGEQCESMAKTLGLTFEWSLAQSSVISVGDDHLLEMALLNLLANAFEAAGPGGRVTLRGERKEGRWVMTVRDDGPGLEPPPTGDDPFLKRDGGLGLGLEVARKAAKLHGGALVLGDNAKRSGMRAVLSLPIKVPERGEVLRDPACRMEWRGGFSTALVEFSHLLPLEEFYASNSLD